MNRSVTTKQSFDEVCQSILPIQKDTIVFGVAEDGFPVLYSTNPAYHRNIFVKELYSGQGIKFLKSSVEFILKYKTGRPVDVVILSNNEWEPISGVSQNGCECVSVSRFDSPISEDVLEALEIWNGKTSRPLVLFVDDICQIKSMNENSKFCFNEIVNSSWKKTIFVIATSGVGNFHTWDRLFGAKINYLIDDSLWFEEELKNHMQIVKFKVIEPTI